MLDDLNKTTLTKDVTSAVVDYLDIRGCKPIETEVQVQPGWIADVATVIIPTQTELIDLKLLKRAPRWNHPDRQEWREAADKMTRLMTVAVEVKTSLSDFRRERKWALIPPVDLAYVAIPAALNVSHDKVPATWGILLHGPDPHSLRCVRPPVPQQVNVTQQLNVVLQVAIRRDHDTRHKRLRELRRSELERRNADKSITRTMTACRAMLAIAKGEHESTERALEYYGIKGIPAYYLPTIQNLWGVAQR